MSPLYSVVSTWVVVATDASVAIVPRSKASLVVEKTTSFIVVSIEVTVLVCASVESDKSVC